MPLQWKLNPSQQFVTVTGEGEVTLTEIEAYLSEIERSNAIGWRKLVDLRDAQADLAADDVIALGLRFREADAAGEVGALAVVMPKADPERVMRLLGFLAAAKRPLRIFQAIEPARRWIKAPRRQNAAKT